MAENNQKLNFNKPLVSILMPVYNSFVNYRSGGKPLLNQAIESLLAQSYKNFELIIVDNQSSDATPDVCKSYAAKDKRIRYIVDSKKQRAEEGIGFAASIMKGSYCMVANDDDLWDPDYILKLITFLENHEEIDMAYSNVDFIDVHNKVTRYSIVSEKDAYDSKASKIDNFCIYSRKRNAIPILFGLFRSDVFHKILPYEAFDDLRANIDNFVTMKFFLLGFKCHLINESLFFYRDRGRKLSDVPLIPGMPSLDTPFLLWLYYVRHQLYFFRKINSFIEEEVSFSKPINIFLRSVGRDEFISHSIGLLHWIRNDYIKDSGNKSIYRKLIKFIKARAIVKDIPIISSSGENDIRYHPRILLKRLENSFQRTNSFLALLNFCVSLLSIKEKSEIISDLESLMEEEIKICEKEQQTIKAFQENTPFILSKTNVKQRFFPKEKPKVSVITMSYNTGRFLRDTMQSIVNQSYEDFEHIVVDGASTDNSLQILKEYPHIRLISERDSGTLEAFRKGLAVARGEYILQCAASDGYIDEHWIAKCVEILDRDKEVSLVWGLPQYMTEYNELGDISYPQFHNALPPQKIEFAYYWLAANFWLPEGNYCVRREVIDKCFPQYKKGFVEDMAPWLNFNHPFNALGYLPYFIPTVANFGRIHKGQLGQKANEAGFSKKRLKNHLRKIKRYKRKLMLRTTTHKYRNGVGELLPYEFSVSRLILKYMFSPINIIRNITMFSAVHFGFISKKWPRFYNSGRKVFHKLTR